MNRTIQPDYLRHNEQRHLRAVDDRIVTSLSTIALQQGKVTSVASVPYGKRLLTLEANHGGVEEKALITVEPYDDGNLEVPKESIKLAIPECRLRPRIIFTPTEGSKHDTLRPLVLSHQLLPHDLRKIFEAIKNNLPPDTSSSSSFALQPEQNSRIQERLRHFIEAQNHITTLEVERRYFETKSGLIVTMTGTIAPTDEQPTTYDLAMNATIEIGGKVNFVFEKIGETAIRQIVERVGRNIISRPATLEESIGLANMLEDAI